jgi:hypothetical protein
VTRPRNAAALVVTGLAAAWLTACGSGGEAQDPFAGPWGDEFRRLYDEAEDNPFIREIVADGEITSLENAEIEARVEECLALGDVPDRFQTDPGRRSRSIGIQTRYPTPQEERLRRIMVLDECLDRYDRGITNLYWVIQDNPDNIENDQRVLDCLIRNELAPPGWTVDEMLAAERGPCPWPEHATEAGLRDDPCWINVRPFPGQDCWDEELPLDDQIRCMDANSALFLQLSEGFDGVCSHDGVWFACYNPDHNPVEVPRQTPFGYHLDDSQVMRCWMDPNH